VHRIEVLEALTAAVREDEPAQILVTGDLAHIGLPAEIRAATAWLESLGPPERVLLVPGNHDVYAADSWAAVVAAWRGYLNVGCDGAGPDSGFPTVRELHGVDGPVSLIGLSSACPTPAFSAQGRLGRDQLDRLERRLAGAPGLRCLLIHHPPLPRMTRWRKSLVDAPALARLLAEHPVQLVLHGHSHRDTSALGPAAARVFGTASASSAEGLASYRRFDVTRSQGGWRLQMDLVGVDAAGRRVLRETASWQVALATPAAASAAGR
jgi:3',5'-cyclic AMP phosphodiesterase CpdA